MIDEHTIRVLEFGKIRDMVAERAGSELGREEAYRLRPTTDQELIIRSFEEISEMKESLLSGEDLPFAQIRDLREVVKTARVPGSVLPPEALAAVASLLRAAGAARALFTRSRERTPRLAGLVQGIQPLEELESEIERSIDPQGEILDTASRRLRRIRKELESRRQEVHERLAALAETKGLAGALQEKIITLRDGRYVVPVKGNERSRIKGIVHDVSASGATLFMEPIQVVEGNNRLRQLACEEEDEIGRILAELTSGVRGSAEAIDGNLEVLRYLDLRYAEARLSIDLDSIPPEMNREGEIEILSGRHPLLVARPEGREVVPLDVRLGHEDGLLLLLTGPNTGGKTVALKTIGLLTLMAQAGLHVPARPGVRLGLFRSVYADIGDEQSIEESLSTFSSHLQQIVKILDEADEQSLVLLDELGVGTDPVQGAALAMAVMEELVRRRARTVATTHYGSLKAFAHERHGMENAAMEFDLETLRPTYRIRMGVPGSSNAFIIARRLGMPSEIASRAEGFIDSDDLKVDQLIARLEEQMAEAEETREALFKKEQAVEEILERYRGELASLDERRRKITERGRQDAKDLVSRTQAHVEELVRELREAGAREEVVRRTRRELRDLSTRLEPRRRKDRHRPVERVELGQPVRVPRLDSVGRVSALPDDQGRVEVELGGMRVYVRLDELAGIDEEERETEGRPPRGSGILVDGPRQHSIRLDLRGAYTADVAERIDKFLDEAEMAGLPTLYIVHGKGTGALRREVERLLRTDPRVGEYHLAGWNEGGTGVTVVTLARDHPETEGGEPAERGSSGG